MAKKWETKIIVLDAKRGNVSVTLKLVDNTDMENIKVLNNCVVLDALIDTPEHKQQVLTELKRQYEEQEQKKKDKAAVVGAFANDINDAAQMWEVE